MNATDKLREKLLETCKASGLTTEETIGALLQALGAAIINGYAPVEAKKTLGMTADYFRMFADNAEPPSSH